MVDRRKGTGNLYCGVSMENKKVDLQACASVLLAYVGKILRLCLLGVQNLTNLFLLLIQ